MKPGTALPPWVPGVSGFTGQKHPVTQPETKPWEIIQMRRTGGGNKPSVTQRRINQMLGRQRKSSQDLKPRYQGVEKKPGILTGFMLGWGKTFQWRERESEIELRGNAGRQSSSQTSILKELHLTGFLRWFWGPQKVVPELWNTLAFEKVTFIAAGRVTQKPASMLWLFRCTLSGWKDGLRWTLLLEIKCDHTQQPPGSTAIQTSIRTGWQPRGAGSSAQKKRRGFFLWDFPWWQPESHVNGLPLPWFAFPALSRSFSLLPQRENLDPGASGMWLHEPLVLRKAFSFPVCVPPATPQQLGIPSVGRGRGRPADPCSAPAPRNQRTPTPRQSGKARWLFQIQLVL